MGDLVIAVDTGGIGIAQGKDNRLVHIGHGRMDGIGVCLRADLCRLQ